MPDEPSGASSDARHNAETQAFLSDGSASTLLEHGLVPWQTGVLYLMGFVIHCGISEEIAV